MSPTVSIPSFFNLNLNLNISHPPDTIPEEIDVLAEKIASTHDSEILNIASLVHLTRTTFRAYSSSKNVDLAPVLELQRKYIRAYMSLKNISRPAVMSAIASLERAEETIQYLDSLPA